MAPFIGPAWGKDGTPFLVEEATNGQHGHRHKKRTLPVVDEYGNAVCYRRRCSGCVRWLPLDLDHYCVRANGDGLGMQSRCKECNRAEKWMRHKHGAEHERAAQRAAYRRRMEDPEYRARLIERMRRNHALRMAKDPEGVKAKMREARQRYLAQRRNDPEWRRRRNEDSRMGHRLRQEKRAGVDVTQIRTGAIRSGMPKDIGHKTSVPGEPLAGALHRYVRDSDASLEETCKMMGFSARAVSRWDSGEGVSLALADAVLTHLSLCWWDVWTPSTDSYERARQVFEGDDLTKAA